jgi:hypothetical protein
MTIPFSWSWLTGRIKNHYSHWIKITIQDLRENPGWSSAITASQAGNDALLDALIDTAPFAKYGRYRSKLKTAIKAMP